MPRKNVVLKGGWLSEVKDGVPFNFVSEASVQPDTPKTYKITPRAKRALGELWTAQEAADYLRVSRETIYGWIYEKRLKALKANRMIRIEVSELERFLNCA